MSLSTQQFIDTYKGSFAGFNNECVSLFWEFNKDVGSGEAYSAVGASDLWEINGQPVIWDTYDRVNTPQWGDWAIWSNTQGAYTNYDPNAGRGYGHVAMFLSDNANGTAQFFSQNPYVANTMTLYKNGIMGYLRLKTAVVAPQGDNITPIAALQPFQRRVGASGVNRRDAPKVSANLIDTFKPGDDLDFKGFVHGESANGTDIWFVGRYTGGYCSASGFDDESTTGLDDLTPAAPVAPVAGAVIREATSPINYRSAPNRAGMVLDTFKVGDKLNFNKFTHGENVDGNDIWFKGALTGGYCWSGGFSDTSTTGMADESPSKPAPAPAPAPTPAPVVEVYDFVPDFDFVEKIPADIHNLERASDNPGVVVFPPEPEDVVIHQFGTPGVDTITSTINQFKNPNLGDKAVSAHFVVSGKRIVQMVSLKDRAYHAYVVGNNYVGIETDPVQDPDTIASVVKLLKALKTKYGRTLTPIRHRDVPQCSTNCGALINLDNYQIDAVTPAPAPTPVPVTPEPTPAPTPTPTPDPVVTPTPVVITEDDEKKILLDFFTHAVEQYFTTK